MVPLSPMDPSVQTSQVYRRLPLHLAWARGLHTQLENTAFSVEANVRTLHFLSAAQKTQTD